MLENKILENADDSTASGRVEASKPQLKKAKKVVSTRQGKRERAGGMTAIMAVLVIYSLFFPPNWLPISYQPIGRAKQNKEDKNLQNHPHHHGRVLTFLASLTLLGPESGLKSVESVV